MRGPTADIGRDDRCALVSSRGRLGVTMVRTLIFSPSNWAPERGNRQVHATGITLDGKMRPAHYGKDRRGACL